MDPVELQPSSTFAPGGTTAATPTEIVQKQAPPGESTSVPVQTEGTSEESPVPATAAAIAGVGTAQPGTSLGGSGVNHEELVAIREDRFLQATLRVRVSECYQPNCFFLKALAEDCKKEKRPLRLRREDLQTVLIARLQDLWRAQRTNLFRFLVEAFQRAVDDTYSKHLPPEQRRQLEDAVQQQLAGNGALLLTCVELYELQEPPPHAAMEVHFREFLEGAIPTAFTTRLLEALAESAQDGDAAITTAFSPAIDSFFETLTNRTISDYKVPAVCALRFLSSFKPIAKVMVSRPCFDPPFVPPFLTSKRGFVLQEHSLLGRLLSFTVLDGPVLQQSQQQSSAQRIFGASHALTLPYLQSSMQSVRHDLQSAAEIGNQIVKNLCRAGLAERHRVLCWFGEVLSSNGIRARAAHSQLLLRPQNAPESAEPLHAMVLKAQGQTTYGFSANIFFALLLLVEPIRQDKLAEVSPFYATCGLPADRTRAAVVGSLQTEAKLGSDEAVIAAKQFYVTVAEADQAAKFPTEVFWLMIRATRLCFNTFVSEFMRWIQYYQQKHEAGLSPTSQESRTIVAEILGWRAILLHPRLCSLYWHFAHLFFSWLLRCMYTYTPEGTEDSRALALLSSQRWRSASLVLQYSVEGGKSSGESRLPPPQFSMLPSGIVDDVFASVRHLLELQVVYRSLKGGHGYECSPCSCMDTELITAVCIAVMRASSFFRSVHTRCDGACRTLYRLFLQDEFRSRLESLPVARQLLLPALVEAFIDSQKGSYYDRINFRIPIVDMLQRLLLVDDYREAIRALAASHTEKFLHLVHLLLSDVSALVDQAMEALVEIRKRQLEGRDTDQAPLPGQPASRGRPAAAAAGSSGATNQDGDNNESDYEQDVALSLDGHSALQREPWSRLESTARDLCSLGFSACVLFALLARHCGASISNSSSVLPQAVTTLDCCLDHLVGPRCLQLKVNAMDRYNFQPKSWLSKVLEGFIYLLKADRTNGEAVTHEILRDGRYYKHANMSKAFRIARREGLMASALLEEFHGLVRNLADVEETDKDFDFDGIPGHFLDPIMADLMTDPVKLPTSNIIMDRRNIERHLMSEPSDPFNRAPLTREQLQPQPELKAEIEAFVASMKAAKSQ